MQKAATVPTLEPVPFRNDTIFSIEHTGEPYTPVRPIVENMGLDWAAQYSKLNKNKNRWGVVMIATPSNGGTQKMLCIPVRKLPGFLATINPSKVKNELRGKIVAYQNECDDVLWNYWNSKQQPALPESAAKIDLKHQAKLLRAVRKEIEKGIPAELARYAEMADAEDKRRNTVKQRLQELLSNVKVEPATPDPILISIEAKLDAILYRLR